MDDPCRCPACQIAEETNDIPQGPLPAYLLADTSDQLAEALSDFAGELNLHHVEYEKDARILELNAKWLTAIGKVLREETCKG